MALKKPTRAEGIMVLMKKAFNTPGPDMKNALKYLEAAHDAVEELERDADAMATWIDEQGENPPCVRHYRSKKK